MKSLPINDLKGFSRKKVPVILQAEIAECGLASIAMIANYYGHQISLRHLRQKYSASADGISLYQIIKIFGELGLTSRPLQLSFEYLKELKTPSILFWNKYHFVVLEKVTDRGIYIVDPAVGRRFIPTQEAIESFSSVALEVYDNIDKEISICNEKNLNPLGFFSILKTNPGLLAYLIPMGLLSIFIYLGAIAAPKLFSTTIDEVIVKNDIDLLYLLVYIFSTIFAFKTIASYLRTLLNNRLKIAISQDIGMGVLGKLFSLPLSYFDKRQKSDVIRRVQSVDYSAMQFTAGWVDISIDVIFSLVFLGLMWAINSEIAIVISIISIVFVMLRLFSIPILTNKYHKSIEAETKRNHTLLSALNDIENIKMTNSSSKDISLWGGAHAQTTVTKAEVEKIQELCSVLHGGLTHLQSIILSVLGATAVLKGDVSVGQLFTFVLYKELFMDSVLKVLERYMSLKIAKTEVSRIDDILQENSEVINKNYSASNADGKSNKIEILTIKDLSYSYGSFDKNIISNANISISGTEKIAIFGESGKGKSTLLKIIAGLYSPNKGKLMINNTDLDDFGIINYRENISYVNFNEEVFTGSVIDNIVMGDDTYDHKWVENVVALSGFDSVINILSNGYNTLIGPSGVRLSTGQYQRLIISRALYRKPDLILLDEPTSHLDINSRDLIIETIKNLPIMGIIVTHDKDLAQACDRIYEI